MPTSRVLTVRLPMINKKRRQTHSLPKYSFVVYRGDRARRRHAIRELPAQDATGKQARDDG